jgi:hypothetical protein
MTLERPLQLVSTKSGLDIPRLRKLACELREWAIQSKWPDLREKLIHAAESLELQAVELDASF